MTFVRNLNTDWTVHDFSYPESKYFGHSAPERIDETGDMVPYLGGMMPSIAPVDATIGYGLTSLVEELRQQGVDLDQLRKVSGLATLSGSLTHDQRLALVKSAHALSNDPLLALRAGAQQRIHHFGTYGFALATSPTFGDAFFFGRQHLDLAGAPFRISFRKEGREGVMETENPEALGELLPFATEYWRASMVTLMSQILEDHFPSTLMRFPYPRPRHWRFYSDLFRCPLEFESTTMEWHFDIDVLSRPCPNANSVTSSLCQDFCEEMMTEHRGESPLRRELRKQVLGNGGRRYTSSEAASALGLSRRTLFRRLSEDGISFQELLDQTHASLACEYLENTRLSIAEIAIRCGFGDDANFRKAFQRWQGKTPSAWRKSPA